MIHIIQTIRITRRNFLELAEKCSLEQLNTIPPGFNNNIIWNLAHIISSQQALCYELSNLPTVADISFVDAYRPGTKPTGPVHQEQFNRISALLLSTTDQLEKDYLSGLFTTYTTRQTKYGVLINTIEEAIPYISVHEGLHFGFAKALRQLLMAQ